MVIGLATFGAWSASAAGNTIYVAPPSPDGIGVDNGECGTPLAPCATIQYAVDKASAGDIIDIAAGTYAETVTLSKWLTLDGAGPTGAAATIIDPVSGRGIVVNAGGASAGSRLVIEDLKITDTTDGIYVSSGDSISHLTISNVVSSSNLSADGSLGNGLHFAGTGSVSDIIVTGGTFSSNSGAGIRIATAVPSFDGLTLTTSVIASNGKAGFDYNPAGTVSNIGTNFTIEDVAFSGNNTSETTNVHEVSFFAFHGNATLRRVTVSAVKASYGIVFTNRNTLAPLGTVILDDVTVDGTVVKGGLTFQYFSDTSAVSLTDVDVSGVTAPWGQFILHSSDPDPFPLGTTTLKTAVLWLTSGIDATQATFLDSSAPYAALSRDVVADGWKVADQIYDAIDTTGLGLIRWKTGAVYVTSGNTIQRAIDAASDGDTVHVKAGAYTGDVTVASKRLTLAGAKAGVPAGPAASPAGRDVDPTGGYTGETTISGSLSVSGSSSSGTVVDGLVIDTSGTSVYLVGDVGSATIRNNVITGRGFTGSSGIEKQATTVARTFVIANNWFKGGTYAMQFNEDRDGTSYLIDGNYITGAQRAIQTFGSSVGDYTITNNLMEAVTVGVRLARDGATIAGNTIRDLTGSGTTQAAIRVDIGVTTVPAYSRIDQSRGITVRNNLISGGDYGVSLESPLASRLYTVTANRFGAYAVKTLRTTNAQAVTEVSATTNYWGQSTGPDAAQNSAATGSTIITSPWITSASDDVAYAGRPGYWPTSIAIQMEDISAPTTVPLGGENLGNPSIEIASAPEGATITVAEQSPEALPDVITPFKLAEATLIEITVSEGVEGPFTVCLDGNQATDSLWHYEGGTWVDITWRIVPTPDPMAELDPDDYTGQVCGMTADLSPFAAASSKAELTVTPANQRVTAGDPVPTYTFGVTGFVGGETAATADGYVAPTCTSTYTTSSPAGTLPITCSGGSADDYLFDVSPTATLTIDPAPSTGGGGGGGGGGSSSGPTGTLQAKGDGSYRIGTARVQFDLAVRKTTATSGSVVFNGNLVWTVVGRWRLSGAIGNTPTRPAYRTIPCPSGIGAKSCTTISGTGVLQRWDGAAWRHSSYGAVTFTITIYDGGSGKDRFGMQIHRIASSRIPESAPVALAGGWVRIG